MSVNFDSFSESYYEEGADITSAEPTVVERLQQKPPLFQKLSEVAMAFLNHFDDFGPKYLERLNHVKYN